MVSTSSDSFDSFDTFDRWIIPANALLRMRSCPWCQNCQNYQKPSCRRWPARWSAPRRVVIDGLVDDVVLARPVRSIGGDRGQPVCLDQDLDCRIELLGILRT